MLKTYKISQFPSTSGPEKYKCFKLRLAFLFSVPPGRETAEHATFFRFAFFLTAFGFRRNHLRKNLNFRTARFSKKQYASALTERANLTYVLDTLQSNIDLHIDISLEYIHFIGVLSVTGAASLLHTSVPQ